MEKDSRKCKSEAPPATCCFGDHLNEECHKDCFKHNITDLETLPGDDQIVLKRRAQIMVLDTSVTTICDYHKYKFVNKFKSANVCANIFSKHPKSTKKMKVGHVINSTDGNKVAKVREEKLHQDGKFVEVVMMK